ncbi:unnamed protein product, partial [Prorocentrum cordatum]
MVVAQLAVQGAAGAARVAADGGEAARLAQFMTIYVARAGAWGRYWVIAESWKNCGRASAMVCRLMDIRFAAPPRARCCAFFPGASAASKGALIGILQALGQDMFEGGPSLKSSPCFESVVAGRPSCSGLLAPPPRGKAATGACCLLWYNSEIKRRIDSPDWAFREGRFTQLAGGAEIGKRTENEDACVRQNPWFTIGVQREFWQKRFGASDIGRPRASTVRLDVKEGAPFIGGAKCAPESFAARAAMHDAASDMMRRIHCGDALAATIGKFVGEGFGSIAGCNVGPRNAEWARAVFETGLDAAVPQDCVVRFGGATAASRQLSRRIVAQCFAESAIAASAAKGCGHAVGGADGASHVQFRPVVNAARRFLDSVAGREDWRRFVDEAGLPCRAGNGKVNRPRNSCFQRGPEAEVLAHGGKDVRAVSARAEQWQAVGAWKLRDAAARWLPDGTGSDDQSAHDVVVELAAERSSVVVAWAMLAVAFCCVDACAFGFHTRKTQFTIFLVTRATGAAEQRSNLPARALGRAWDSNAQ